MGRWEAGVPAQETPGGAVHRAPGRAARHIAASPAITERGANGTVTGLTAAGHVASRRNGRRNPCQIPATTPVPEPASQEPATGEALAL